LSIDAIYFWRMSAIASFYVLPHERLTGVVDAAAPVAAGWFRGKQDRFWAVLRGCSRELETFAWSGWVFNTLEMYLMERHGFSYVDFGDPDVSQQLTKARGASWLLLTAASADRLRAALDGVEWDSDDVTAFVVSEHGAEAAAEGAAAAQAAFAALKTWLAELTPGSVGILAIA
jgi:hypothetical protein